METANIYICILLLCHFYLCASKISPDVTCKTKLGIITSTPTNNHLVPQMLRVSFARMSYNNLNSCSPSSFCASPDYCCHHPDPLPPSDLDHTTRLRVVSFYWRLLPTNPFSMDQPEWLCQNSSLSFTFPLITYQWLHTEFRIEPEDSLTWPTKPCMAWPLPSLSTSF